MSEVVQAGLRLLEDQERLNDIELVELRQAIATGLKGGQGGNTDDVFARLEVKYQNMTANEANPFLLGN